MNPLFDLRNIILLIVMIVSGISGYYIGSFKGRDAIETLEKAKSAATQAQQLHDDTEKSLKTRISSLENDYQKEKEKLNDAHEKQNTEWEAIKAGRDARIAELTQTVSTKRAEIDTLKQGVSSKKTGSKERIRLDNRIVDLEKEQKAHEMTIAGEECAKVPVPIETLQMLREVL
jgi:DNA repair exonuclease SbcCD ATPase subunit